jgi:hypothetical protein
VIGPRSFALLEFRRKLEVDALQTSMYDAFAAHMNARLPAAGLRVSPRR